ncbi:hypothetical protein F5Y04DRAFT_231510 [Hypomontagnella monticulosa]|nr:hypothetical protein F5Y04DRAFT_231510 [Hypomontagnella monticulosa]
MAHNPDSDQHKRKRDISDDNGSQAPHADRIPQPPPPQSGKSHSPTPTPITHLHLHRQSSIVTQETTTYVPVLCVTLTPNLRVPIMSYHEIEKNLSLAMYCTFVPSCHIAPLPRNVVLRIPRLRVPIHKANQPIIKAT